LTLMGYIKVMRPPLTILGAVASFALVLWAGKPLLYEGLLIILAIFFGNMGYTMMNEVVDADVDAKNKPWKPIPSGQADLEKVLIVSSFLIAASFCTVIILTICYGLFYLVGLLGLVFSHIYDVLRKDLLGNVCMSGAYGIAALMSLYPKYPLFSVAFALFTFAFNLAVQYQDLEAERTVGVVTAPQQLGKIGTCLLGVVLSYCSGTLFCLLGMKTGYSPLIAFAVSASLSMLSASSILYVSPESKVQEILNRYLARIFLLIGFVWMIISEVI